MTYTIQYLQVLAVLGLVASLLSNVPFATAKRTTNIAPLRSDGPLLIEMPPNVVESDDFFCIPTKSNYSHWPLHREAGENVHTLAALHVLETSQSLLRSSHIFTLARNTEEIVPQSVCIGKEGMPEETHGYRLQWVHFIPDLFPYSLHGSQDVDLKSDCIGVNCRSSERIQKCVRIDFPKNSFGSPPTVQLSLRRQLPLGILYSWLDVVTADYFEACVSGVEVGDAVSIDWSAMHKSKDSFGPMWNLSFGNSVFLGDVTLAEMNEVTCIDVSFGHTFTVPPMVFVTPNLNRFNKQIEAGEISLWIHEVYLNGFRACVKTTGSTLLVASVEYLVISEESVDQVYEYRRDREHVSMDVIFTNTNIERLTLEIERDPRALDFFIAAAAITSSDRIRGSRIIDIKENSIRVRFNILSGSIENLPSAQHIAQELRKFATLSSGEQQSIVSNTGSRLFFDASGDSKLPILEFAHSDESLCSVGPWKFGNCSEDTCSETGGQIELTRTAESLFDEGICPEVTRHRPCNYRPCTPFATSTVRMEGNNFAPIGNMGRSICDENDLACLVGCF